MARHKSMKPKLDKNSVSLAGEFAVLAQLALRGYDANMTLGRTKGVDILVPKTKKMYKLEVKTKYRTSRKESRRSKVHGTVIGEWMMSKGNEKLVDSSLFYCFVIICQPTSSFEYFIVSSQVVARYVRMEHRHWLREKRSAKQKVIDTNMRMFRMGFRGNKYPIATPIVERYKDNWSFRP
jgi:hypothetical protein